jgi:hypothetical protein
MSLILYAIQRIVYYAINFAGFILNATPLWYSSTILRNNELLNTKHVQWQKLAVWWVDPGRRPAVLTEVSRGLSQCLHGNSSNHSVHDYISYGSTLCSLSYWHVNWLNICAPKIVVGWGTRLQAIISRVRFLMRPLDFSIDLILSAALLPRGRLNL